MLPQSQKQEALSRAYVRVIAAQAGVMCADVTPDFGIDMYLRDVEEDSGTFGDVGPQVDLQLRTATGAEVRDVEVAYDIDIRTYNRLRRTPVHRPCFLVLLVLPADESLWVSQSVEELVVRRCAYWFSLEGMGPTTNQATIRITTPRTNVFSAAVVRSWMATLVGGLQP
jgi:Domain of unknown function (DUF4365)